MYSVIHFADTLTRTFILKANRLVSGTSLANYTSLITAVGRRKLSGRWVVDSSSRIGMAPLRFCANISWLFTELPDFSQRMYAAAAAGFQAVEAAWLYDSDLSELRRAREATGVEVALINTPPGTNSSARAQSGLYSVRVSQQTVLTLKKS